MNKKTRWITETAVLLALLICLQWVGSLIPHQMTKQLITGTLVNCVLAVTVLTVGMGSGITVALISPILAFLLGIAPQINFGKRIKRCKCNRHDKRRNCMRKER